MSSTENETKQLTDRDYERTLSSIGADARKISDLLAKMEDDAKKLDKGGHPAPAHLVRESITAQRVGLAYMREAFRVEF